MLSAFIRHSEAVGRDVPKFGRLAHELEQEIVNNPTRSAIRRQGGRQYGGKHHLGHRR